MPMHFSNFKRTHISEACSIICPRHIAPRNDSVLIDVSWEKSIASIIGLHHITFTDQETPPTSDVVYLHTVDDIRISVCQVKGEGRDPR